MDNVLQTMVNEQIGSGEQVNLFMSAFASYVGCSKACGFRTCPDCIRTALQTASVNSETTVAISPLAPSVYLEKLRELGCKVVYVDVSKENGLPSEEAVAGSGASVLVLYENSGSIPVKYDSSENVPVACDFGNVTVIEDISESIGSSFGQFKPGMWGSIVVCSFEQDDVVSAGGGAALAVKEGFEQFVKGYLPCDYLKMTDMGAALGSVQLENLDENCAKCREIFELYSNGIKTTKHKVFGVNLLGFKVNGGSFDVFLDCKPDDIMEFARKKDVPVIKTFAKSIADKYEGDLFEVCPVCASYYHRTISFPIYPFLKASEIDLISKIISHLP